MVGRCRIDDLVMCWAEQDEVVVDVRSWPDAVAARPPGLRAMMCARSPITKRPDSGISSVKVAAQPGAEQRPAARPHSRAMSASFIDVDNVGRTDSAYRDRPPQYWAHMDSGRAGCGAPYGAWRRPRR